MVTQRTGSEKFIPDRRRPAGFDTPDEAVDAIRRSTPTIRAMRARAREIAVEYFDAVKLLDEVAVRGDLNDGPTPLQSMLGLDVLPRDLAHCRRERPACWSVCWGSFACAGAARVTATTFLLLSVSALIDAGSRFIPNPAGRREGRGRGLRAFPVRRDPAGARVRRRGRRAAARSTSRPSARTC